MAQSCKVLGLLGRMAQGSLAELLGRKALGSLAELADNMVLVLVGRTKLVVELPPTGYSMVLKRMDDIPPGSW
jgi:hypothetical protein